MKKGDEARWSHRIWKDTGVELDEQKIFRSVLGNYAIEKKEGYLMTITINTAKEAGVNVD